MLYRAGRGCHGPPQFTYPQRSPFPEGLARKCTARSAVMRPTLEDICRALEQRAAELQDPSLMCMERREKFCVEWHEHHDGLAAEVQAFTMRAQWQASFWEEWDTHHDRLAAEAHTGGMCMQWRTKFWEEWPAYHDLLEEEVEHANSISSSLSSDEGC